MDSAGHVPSDTAWSRAPGAHWSRPSFLVAAVCLLTLLLWGGGAAMLHPEPPTDSLEQLLFAQELRLDYAKHPPLPSWLLWAASAVVGPSVGLTFILGAAMAAAALAILYLWARELVGAERAALATLLSSLVIYYNAVSCTFSHKTVLLPMTIASIALFHRALSRERLRDWLVFGAVAGVALLAKLSMLVIFAAMALFMLGWRRDVLLQRWPALAAAMLVALAVAGVPLAALYLNQAEARQYVGGALATDASVLVRLESVWNFMASAAASIAPALLGFALLGHRPAAKRAVRAPVPLAPFIAVIGFGPLVLIGALAMVTGAHLLSTWATQFFSLLTLWLVAVSPWRCHANAGMLRRATLLVALFQCLLWATLMLNGGRLPNLSAYREKPALAPSSLSEAVAREWRRHSTAPLPPVAANIRNGAPLAIGWRGQPLVVDGNRTDFDRRVPATLRRDCGLLVLTGPVDPQQLRPALPSGIMLDPVDALDAQLAAHGTTLAVQSADTRGRITTWRLAAQWPEPADGSACRLPRERR